MLWPIYPDPHRAWGVAGSRRAHTAIWPIYPGPHRAWGVAGSRRYSLPLTLGATNPQIVN